MKDHVAILQRRRAQRGSVLVIVAAMSLILIAFTGLAVDGGEIEVQQRESQNAADGAALAAATAITNSDNYGYMVTDAKNIGWAVAGYTNIPASDVAFTFLDSTGAATTSPHSVVTVKADVTHTFQTLFLPVMNIDTATVSAHAAVTLNQNPSVNCGLCALSSTASPAINLLSGGQINVTGGAAKSDSSASPSITVSGGGSLTSDTGVTAVGSVSGGTTPSATTGAAQSYSDPFSGIPTPTLGASAQSGSFSSTTTINPGTYQNMTIASGATVTMRPGVYIIAGNPASGAELTVNGTLNGSNVFIYFTCQNSVLIVSQACTGTSAGDININGSMTVSAPAAGSNYTGLVMFVDRLNPNSINLAISATITPTGTVYAPDSGFSISHGSHNSLSSRVVVNTVTVSNGGRLNIAYTVSSNYVAPGKIKLTT